MTVRDAAEGRAMPAPGELLPPVRKRYRPGSLEIFGAVLLLAIAFRGPLESFLGHPVMQSWSTVFVAICVQATPFLVLGVVVSGAIAAFVPATVFADLTGVSDLEVHGESVRCSVRGPVDSVLKAAARYEVVDLRSHEPGLEELFLEYYPTVEEAS